MRNILKSTALLFVISCAAPFGKTFAEGNLIKEDLIQSQNGNQIEVRLLREVCDSLALTDNFEGIIQIAHMYVTDPNYTSVVVPYMVPAYYFTGDTVKSKNLLLKTIKDKSYLQITTEYLTSSNYALIKYFRIDKNREPIITRVLDKYKNEVKASRPKEGQQVLRFYINDQRIRKMKQAYSRADESVKNSIQQYQVKEDALQNENLTKFYKEKGKYFDGKEVGPEVSSMQLIYFSHITGVKQRETFYQPLLEKAEKEGTIDKANLVNFILRTESITDPKFWETINERIPEIRKKYNLPENYMFSPF